jgi:hypothetical protein
MLTITYDFKLLVSGVEVAQMERKATEYEVFVYKNLTTESFEVYYTPDAHKEEDEDFENFQFYGSTMVPADPELSLSEKKKQALKHLYDKVNGIYNFLVSEYSVLEKESWVEQEREARALLAVKTPTIDALCAVRGCSRDYLAVKIVENADEAKQAGLSVLAWQQEVEERIKVMGLEGFSTIWEEITNK